MNNTDRKPNNLFLAAAFAAYGSMLGDLVFNTLSAHTLGTDALSASAIMIGPVAMNPFLVPAAFVIGTVLLVAGCARSGCRQ